MNIETMPEYHKIPTVFKRDPDSKYKTLLDGQYSSPELEYLTHNVWIYTEKVNGINIRVSTHAGELVIEGRHRNAQIPKQLLSKLEDMFPPSLLSSVFEDDNFVLYGEGYGARVRKGSGNYNPDGMDFVLFDTWIDGWWLRRNDVEDVANKLRISVVPIIGEGSLWRMAIQAREGFPSQWGDFQAEGIVARPKAQMFNRGGQRIITKIKCKDFARAPSGKATQSRGAFCIEGNRNASVKKEAQAPLR